MTFDDILNDPALRPEVVAQTARAWQAAMVACDGDEGRAMRLIGFRLAFDPTLSLVSRRIDLITAAADERDRRAAAQQGRDGEGIA